MRIPRVVSLVALLAIASVFVGVSSASARPSQVGLVSFTGASTTSLTLDWPKASGARGYEVFRSLHTSMAYAKKVKSTRYSSVKISGLKPGVTYCFQVRARAGSSFGVKSAHTCKPTIRGVSQSTVASQPISVMTLNACSDVCSGWSRRDSAAAKMIATRSPDVVATQEANSWTSPPSGYAQAYSYSAKRLFYKTSRFSVASTSQGRRAGEITLSSGKFAVWAELVDKTRGKHIIFVSVHTTPAFSKYALRGQEIQNLLRAMDGINYNGDLPVVYAGDFNSHKNRGTYSERAGFGSQDTVGRTFAAAGYYDSYDLARHLKRPNWNSYSAFKTKPTVSKTWGDHVDHVYIVPSQTNVYRWMNAALYSGSRYSTPIPSDHSAVMVTLYIP